MLHLRNHERGRMIEVRLILDHGQCTPTNSPAGTAQPRKCYSCGRPLDISRGTACARGSLYALQCSSPFVIPACRPCKCLGKSEPAIPRLARSGMARVSRQVARRGRDARKAIQLWHAAWLLFVQRAPGSSPRAQEQVGSLAGTLVSINYFRHLNAGC